MISPTLTTELQILIFLQHSLLILEGEQRGICLVLVYAWFRQVCILSNFFMFEFPAYLLCVFFIFIADGQVNYCCFVQEQKS